MTYVGSSDNKHTHNNNNNNINNFIDIKHTCKWVNNTYILRYEEHILTISIRAGSTR